jgi:hypothetical protein
VPRKLTAVPLFPRVPLLNRDVFEKSLQEQARDQPVSELSAIEQIASRCTNRRPDCVPQNKKDEPWDSLPKTSKP